MTIGIYALRDPRTSELRYVGQSVDIERRFRDHCNPVGGWVVIRWELKLKRMGLQPGLVILEECTTEQLNNKEIQWIFVLRERGELLNRTDGGGGFGIGRVVSEHVRIAHSTRMREFWSDPERRKHRIAVFHSPEVVARNSAAQKIAQNKPEVRAKKAKTLYEGWADPIRRAARLRSLRRPEIVARRKESMKRPEVISSYSDGVKRYWDSLSENELQEKSKAYTASQHRPDVREKRNAGVKKYWESLTAEQRQVRSAKLRAGIQASLLRRKQREL